MVQDDMRSSSQIVHERSGDQKALNGQSTGLEENGNSQSAIDPLSSVCHSSDESYIITTAYNDSSE